MLIEFFPNGTGAGAGPVGYLVAERVLAYDSNRDLIRDAAGQPLMVTRDPLPEVPRGDPSRTETLIDASRHQWTYRADVISFAAEDAPSEAQQAEVMEPFEQLAFVGLDGEQYDMLWVHHSHEDRVELHFCTPRLELTTGRSLDIAPPGYQDAYDSLLDLMHQRTTAGPTRWSWSTPRSIHVWNQARIRPFSGFSAVFPRFRVRLSRTFPQRSPQGAPSRHAGGPAGETPAGPPVIRFRCRTDAVRPAVRRRWPPSGPPTCAGRGEGRWRSRPARA